MRGATQFLPIRQLFVSVSAAETLPCQIFQMFPDFIVIGAQRAGSTWLYKAMRSHPAVWLPPVKELHYFDHAYPPAALQGSARPYAGDTGLRKLLRTTKRVAWILANAAPTQGLKKSAWMWRYTTGQRNDEWYASLFEPAPGQLAGDITPAYSTLDKTTIEHIHALRPDAKILLVMRNPVERAWSGAVRNLAKASGRQVADIPREEFIDAFQRPGARLRGDYPKMLENWGAVFDASRFYIGFYDDIATDPVGLLQEIYSFLELDVPEGAIPASIKARVNAGPGARIPPDLHRWLCEFYAEDLDLLAQRLGGAPARWRDSAKAVLEGTSTPGGDRQPAADTGAAP